MTQEELIEMATEAGLAYNHDDYPDIWDTYMNVGREEIMVFAKLIAAKEREDCAKVAEHSFGVIGRTIAIAIRARGETLAQEQDIAALVEGMEVSIDVSTGEHDSGNRLFGTVTLAQENQGSKHGLILLVQEPKANFKEALAQRTEQEPVAWRTFDGEGQYQYRAYEENESYADDWNKRNPNHKGWVDPLYTHSPKRTWVGLTDDEMEATFIECGGKWNGDFWKIEDADFHPFLRTIEAKLKGKNT
jgi:hypothetical protein